MQIVFLKSCIKQVSIFGSKNAVAWMLKHRENKYKMPLPEYENKEKYTYKMYRKNDFHIWCSGFIEAEGCFCCRSSGQLSFSIGQKNEEMLITSLRDTFGGSNKIRLCKDSFFLWKVYKKAVLYNIISHLETYPLLGFKKKSFAVFLTTISAKYVY